MDEQRNWPTVLLAVQRQPGANTVQVAEDIHRFLPQLAEQLPASVQLLTIFDKSQSIRDSLAEVKWTLFIAFGLVIGVVFISLGKIVDTWIPSLVLPLSIVGTCAFMYLLGYTIDNLSLLALILAIGFIIDDAIVVLENIVRRVEEGENPWTAAIQGSKQISFTILSMTLSLIAVFIPMVFMGGLIGKIFREFAVTLVIITFISGAISLTLTPMLCSRLIKGQKQGKMERFALGINRAMLALYRPILKWMLKHRWLPLLMGAASLAASLYFFYSLPKDFIPDDDIGFIVAYTQSQEGTSADRMMAYQNQVAAIIRGDPNVQSLVSIAAYPQYFLHLKPRHERASVQEIMQGIYAKLLFVPGINTFLKNVPLIDLSIGSQSKGSYQYTLQSMDKGALYDATEKLVQRMQEWPEFQAVTSDLEIRTPQLQIEVLRDQASSLGISADEIESALQLAYAGGAVSRIATERDQYDVILELQPEFRAHPAALASIYVRSQFNGRLVPLSAVARWKTVLGPSSINHVGQFPATTISFSLTSDVPLETALKHLNEAAKEVLPATVMGTVKGAAQTFEESMQSSAFLLLMAILAIYIVLGILYESFIHPLIILSTLPPATLGGLLTLKLLAFPLSLYAYLGLILLIGIVKKNGIMLVDYALEHERTLGQSPREAIYNACLVRFRPIMMTTWTAVMGALPIALAVGPGAESRKPLGWVIIGGLLFSQLITLFVTPAIYLYLGNLSRFFSFANLERKNQAQALK
jgi:hydrophobic/amphiphilic exporter-1 (mainly G- bacteria), HAE1 family